MLIYDVPTDQLEKRLEAKRAEFKQASDPVQKFRIASDCSVIVTAISWRKKWVDNNGN